MKIRAYTLLEQAMVAIILGIIAAVIMATMKRPSEFKSEALQKAGKSTFIQIEFASKNILAKYTKNYTLTRMIDSSGEFSVADTGSLARMVALYKKTLVGKRTSTISDTYKNATLTNGSTSLTGVSVGSFSGFILKNGTWFGIKLYGNCTTTASNLYDPSTPTINSKTNSCGLVFFDINGEETPNRLGVDQYIVALGKRGIK